MWGTGFTDPPSIALLKEIKQAEELGIAAVWMATLPTGPDPLTLFAGAGVLTQDILLGSCIVPTFPRHPVVMAQQAQVISQLAPGRFRLGVGPSHRPIIQETFGLNFHAPLGHLSEYLRILKTLLQEGSVDFDGDYYRAHGRIASPVDVPVMASALQAKSFELCGAEADGAISWVCPGAYLRDVALPAMKAGAETAGRPVPPLIAHAPVCVHDNPDEVRAAIREQVSNPGLPFYQRMFAAAGFPEASKGGWSDAMIDATAVWGNESQVMEKLDGLFALGATEILASLVTAGSDRNESLERTLRVLARASS